MDEKQILDRIVRIELIVQTLEERVTNLEKGDFGTGIYLDGCSEADKEYIKNENKKAGEE